MDAFQFLNTEHRKASQLLQQLTRTPDPVRRDLLFRELKQELEWDAEVEREDLYPPLLQRKATADFADGGLYDLKRVQTLLIRLETLPREGDEWNENLNQLQTLLEEHIRKEEDALLRGGQGVFSQRQREDLGERMRTHKLRLIQGGAETGSPRPQTEAIGAAAMGSAEDVGRMAKERSRGFVENQARYLGGQVDGFARALRQTADTMQQRQEQMEIAGYLQRAAGGLDQLSGTLREGNVDDLMARSSAFARSQPALFMGGSVMAGFLLTRFLRSSEKRAMQSPESSR